MTKSDCTSVRDLKGNVALEPSSMSCVTDNIDMDEPVEDKNRNITLKNSISKVVLEGQQIPTSSAKEKCNAIGLHVGPNGLVNGLEIGNRPSGSLSNFIDHMPKPETYESLSSASQSNQQVPSENSVDHKELVKMGRTDCDNITVQPSCSSASEDNGAVVSKPVDIHPISSHGNCDRKTSEPSEVEYVSYKSELQMPDIMRLIQKDLSEPYSIYTYRYFIHNWPKLCFLVSFIFYTY